MPCHLSPDFVDINFSMGILYMILHMIILYIKYIFVQTRRNSLDQIVRHLCIVSIIINFIPALCDKAPLSGQNVYMPMKEKIVVDYYQQHM